MRHLLSILVISLFLSGCSSILFKPESQWTVDEFYTKAKSEFDNGQWGMAIEFYEKLKANFPYGDHAEQAYLELAYSYYRYDEPESAIRELEEFIRIYPKHSQLAYAHYLKAVAADSSNHHWLDKWITDPAYRDVKTSQKAFAYYQEVIVKFPNSRYAKASQRRLVILSNRLARHEIQVAEYYYKRKAYLAAAKRAAQAVESYPLAQSNKKALEIMEKSYAKLGMDSAQDSVRQVIELNN